ncbi:hypothetical protein [Aliivibrio salmonicida]|uniref:hypothetical protein n=1 Tax=Aliivibrio salmonicida TaxID=40269 RepID=UPI003D105F7F
MKNKNCTHRALRKRPTVIQIAARPKFKVGQVVFVAFDSGSVYLNDGGFPVFKMEVEGYEIDVKVNREYKQEVKMQYLLSWVDSFDPDRRKPEEVIFATELEANKYCLTDFVERKELAEKNVIKYGNLINQLVDA